MNNNNFNSFSQILDYKNNIKLSSELLFPQYLSSIYTNLLQREDNQTKNIDQTKGSLRLSQKNLLMKKTSLNFPSQKIKTNDIGISLTTFLDYMNIQEFIGERIFKYLNKSNTNKLNKEDFCRGLNELYYGDAKKLIRFTFALADFNNNGKIYQTDMKLVLVYIPTEIEFYQKMKIKQIDTNINSFFDEKIEKSEDNEEKQMSYNTYLKYVEDYINNDQDNYNNNNNILNDYNKNAPFFYFISITSYILKNLPFNVKNVEYFKYLKAKFKLILYRNDKGNLTERKNYSISKKNIRSYIDIINKTSNKFDLSLKKYQNEENKIKNKYIIYASLSKIDRKDLFQSKIDSSKIKLKKENIYSTLRANKLQRPKNLKHDFIIAKNENKNKMANILPYKEKIYEDKINKINKKYNIFKTKNTPELNSKIILKNCSPVIKLNNTPSLFNKKLSASPELIQKKYLFNNTNNETNGSSTNNNSSSNNLLFLNSKLPSISLSKENDRKIPLSVETKLKDEKRDLDFDEPEEFVLCEQDEDDDPNKKNKNKEEESNNQLNNSNETFAFIINENDNNMNKKTLNKYYVVLSEKELLFFSSELKKELCDLWFIYKSYISICNESINSTNYFSIKIEFNKNSIKKIYFLNEKICSNFAQNIKNSIKNLEFEENYELLEKIGHGHFAEVYKCKYKLNNQIYAVKIIKKSEMKEKDFEFIRQEKNYLKLIKHQNIINLKDIYENSKNIYLITEFCNGGDLLTFLINKRRDNSTISEKLAAKIIKKIAEGIKYLNVFGIVHRDIKPENIMFGNKNDIKSLKIIDLGVCQTLSYGELATLPIGTNGYISPEIYLHHSYSFKVDIWSLGVILYLLITGEILPFDDENMDSHIIGKKVIYTHHEYPTQYFGNRSKGLINLIDKMLEKDDKKRININELMKNKWFEIIMKK